MLSVSVPVSRPPEEIWKLLMWHRSQKSSYPSLAVNTPTQNHRHYHHVSYLHHKSTIVSERFRRLPLVRQTYSPVSCIHETNMMDVSTETSKVRFLTRVIWTHTHTHTLLFLCRVCRNGVMRCGWILTASILTLSELHPNSNPSLNDTHTHTLTSGMSYRDAFLHDYHIYFIHVYTKRVRAGLEGNISLFVFFIAILQTPNINVSTTSFFFKG